MYAVIDIEATGGSYNEEGIIEIAIYQYDGTKITDQFSSLVHTEKPIQQYVQKLTGITPKMLARAPKFHELAKRIIEITDGAIIVGHNVDFDYRMLRQEFKTLGYEFKSKTIDTLPISKKLIPEMQSYSLGKLCQELGIIHTEVHRASGDARATLQLLKLLLDKDLNKIIVTHLDRQEPKITKKQLLEKILKETLTPKLLKLLTPLPQTMGVYYLYDEQNNLIYINRSENIKNNINQDFTGKHKKAIQIQKLTHSILCEETGTKLISLLKESQEIRLNKPKLNQQATKKNLKHGIYLTLIDSKQSLSIDTITKHKKNLIIGYPTLKDTQDAYFHLIKKFNVYQKTEPTDTHNEKVQSLINSINYPNPNFLIIDKGRTNQEKSFILIENNTLKGYGYYSLHHQIKTIDKIHNLLISITETPDLKNLIKYTINKHTTKIECLHETVG